MSTYGKRLMPAKGTKMRKMALMTLRPGGATSTELAELFAGKKSRVGYVIMRLREYYGYDIRKTADKWRAPYIMFGKLMDDGRRRKYRKFRRGL